MEINTMFTLYGYCPIDEKFAYKFRYPEDLCRALFAYEAGKDSLSWLAWLVSKSDPKAAVSMRSFCMRAATAAYSFQRDMPQGTKTSIDMKLIKAKITFVTYFDAWGHFCNIPEGYIEKKKSISDTFLRMSERAPEIKCAEFPVWRMASVDVDGIVGKKEKAICKKLGEFSCGMVNLFYGRGLYSSWH